MSNSSTSNGYYPGKDLGLPASGALSIGRFGRRVAAFFIDSAYSALISFAFFNYDAWATLGVFAVFQVIFIMFAGGSPGHRIMGMRIIRLGGGWVGVWRPFVRTILLCLLLPALVWDQDQRGLHDRLTGCALVRV